MDDNEFRERSDACLGKVAKWLEDFDPDEVDYTAGDGVVTIEFAGRGGETLVFPREEMISATEAILNDNGIRSQGSPDVMSIWTAH